MVRGKEKPHTLELVCQNHNSVDCFKIIPIKYLRYGIKHCLSIFHALTFNSKTSL